MSDLFMVAFQTHWLDENRLKITEDPGPGVSFSLSTSTTPWLVGALVRHTCTLFVSCLCLCLSFTFPSSLSFYLRLSLLRALSPSPLPILGFCLRLSFLLPRSPSSMLYVVHTVLCICQFLLFFSFSLHSLPSVLNCIFGLLNLCYSLSLQSHS